MSITFITASLINQITSYARNREYYATSNVIALAISERPFLGLISFDIKQNLNVPDEITNK